METTQQDRAKGAPLWRWRPLFIVWTIPVLLAAITQRLGPDRGAIDVRPLLGAAIFWYGWALATPAIFALTSRLPPVRPVRLRAVAAHSALAAGIVALASVLLAMTAPFSGETPVTGPFADRFVALATGPAALAMLLIYSLVVAAALGLEARRNALEARARTAALVAERDRLARGLAESRLESLQHQLRPHFLFNTLHAISALMDSRKDAARRMTTRLATLLRASLEAPLEISLDDEIELLESYLDIERLRFGDRLEVDYEIEPSARRVRVPSFLLQPLVENAIRHGFRETRGGRIRIRARAETGRLVISVIDDGRGLSPPAGEEDVGRRNGSHGLANIRARLAGRYGDQASLRVESRPGGGTRARIELQGALG